MTDTVRRVHLFRGNFLLANLTTRAGMPEQIYEVDGVLYEVTSVSPLRLEHDISQGWDVQVTPRG